MYNRIYTHFTLGPGKGYVTDKTTVKKSYKGKVDEIKIPTFPIK